MKKNLINSLRSKGLLWLGLLLILCCAQSIIHADSEGGCVPDPTYLPDMPEYHNIEGGRHYGAKEYEAAIIAYQTALDLDATYFGAHYGLAITYRAMGRLDLAIEHYTQVMDLAPDYGQPYLSRAEIYIFLRRYDQAEADLTQYINLQGQYPVPYWIRGDFYFDQKEYELAINDYTTAINKNIAASALASIYLKRGEAWLSLGENEKAKADFEAAAGIHIP